MKILSIVVPSYNSESYLHHCIDSLLTQKEFVEILIVDDGSTDKTAEIADEYMRKYPDCVRAIHKENGGHGSAVNAGIAAATGRYFKVVDSDDWVGETAYQQVVSFLNRCQNNEIDMLLSNYIYEKKGAKHKKIMQYRNLVPRNQVFGWNDIGNFKLGKYILMHSVIYRLDILKQCQLKLPEHTFYVDNLFVYLPLPYVKKMYYLDVELYHYFIGREDQSVNEKNMIKRIDQQARVNKIMFEKINLTEIDNLKLRKYMFQYLEIITLITNIFALKAHRKEVADDVWNYMKQVNAKQYHKLSSTILCNMIRKSSAVNGHLPLWIYSIAQRIYGFN